MLRRGLALVALALLGCSGKVTQEECDELTDHLVDLLAQTGPKLAHADKVKAEVKADPRAEIVSKQTCLGKISGSQYRCMKAAKSLDAFVACEK
jgi:small lipoprotein (TIGR04454 family)